MTMAKKIKMKESHTRTIVKAVSWRIIATLITGTIVFIFTRKWNLTLGITFFEVISKILFYYFHERIWNVVPWGQKKHPLAEIGVTRDLEPKDMEIIKSKLKDLGYLD